MRKYRFQSVHQHLSNNFVENIAKANRPKFRDFFGIFYFRYQRDESGVYGFKDSTFTQNSKDCLVTSSPTMCQNDL